MSLSNENAKLYDLEITFHSAHALPVSDVPTLAADPYILASLRVPSYSNRDEPSPPPPLLFRTRTIHRTRDPDWGNEVWRVGGVPGAGFVLRASVRDEDAGKKDDRLGEARVSFFGREPIKGKGKGGERNADADWGLVREGLNVERQEAAIKKRRGGARAFVSTYITAAISKAVSRHGGNVVMSVKVLGLSKNQKDRRVYTLGPNYYSIHFSPLIGRMIGTKSTNASNSRKAAVSNFQGNKLQLTGPVPTDLTHKYVGYRPFIESMFSKSGIRGRLLNRALKKQYRYIYSHDQATVYGRVERHQGASNAVDSKPASDSKSEDHADSKDPHNSELETDVNILAAQFLHMTQHGAGHRLYTYVITLDGQWRFTETGDEFAIELLSKHSMHADGARFIAYSGEFFVRRIGTKGWEDDPAEDQDAQTDTYEDSDKDNKHNKHEIRPTKAIAKAHRHPPSQYELVIDNDSGTYRPDKKLLPRLAEFLGNESNLGGPGALGKITAMDGFDEGLVDTKKRRAEAKKNDKSKSGGESRPMVQLKRGSSVSSAQADRAGLGRRSMSSGDVERMVEAKDTANGRVDNVEDGPADEVANGHADQETNGNADRAENGHAHKAENGHTDGRPKSAVEEAQEKIDELRNGPVEVLATN